MSKINISRVLAVSLALSCVLTANENATGGGAVDKMSSVKLNQATIKAEVTLSDTPIELQPKQVSIIESKDILQKSNAGNVQSLLEAAPGIIYSRSGGINGQITFRGQNSNDQRSIITIDGVKYTGRSTLEFNMLDPYAFEAIEIIRGPAGSLYGSDAMTGVVNFRSRKSTYNIGGETFKATARIRALEYGSVNNLFGGRAEVLGGGNGWDMLIGFTGKTAGDYTTPIKENGSYKAKNSKFNSYGVDFNIGYTNQNATRYFLQGRWTRVESHRAGGLAAAPGSSYGIFMTENPISEYYLRAGLKKSNLSFADSMETYLYYRHWDTDIWTDRRGYVGVPKPYVHQQVYNNNYVGGRLIFNTLTGKHNLSYGAEFESAIWPTPIKQIFRADNSSRTTNRASTTTNIAVFAKDDFKATQSWNLSASVRGDYILTTISKKRSDAENVTGTGAAANLSREATELLDKNGTIHQGALTGALGSVFFLNDYISNVINISHNFKAPTAFQRMQATPSGNATLTGANPLIKPEYSQTAEFGFRIQSDNHFISLIGFYTRYTNMIALSTYQSAAVSQGAWRFENVGKAHITGAELEGRHSFFDNMLTFSYVGAYNYSENEVANKPLPYVAPLYGQATLGLNFRPVYFNLTQRAYGAKTRIDTTQERKTTAYTMTDILMGLRLGAFASSMENMELLLGVNNVFDVVGRNPVTAEAINYALSQEANAPKYPLDRALTNPLVEPGRNIFVKYVWNY
ncbi:TonB-dependent receptor [Helicobacter jaachi]|uniref:TonB-dependent receptor n=1 Tax=Helicobacter jaachi TaxID=1677920 RepID=A0A4U8TEE1_9HELI|nr:TonB-dependent receptor [Helicobacter jaachi]TLD97708.1 TonB-dependent receptor [Helicobacter jaachi]